MKKKFILGIIAIMVFTFVDQLVKYGVSSSMAVGDTIPLINNVFHITYVQNYGAAWGSFSGKTVMLLVFTTIMLVLMLYVYIKLLISGKFKLLWTMMIFLISGACGNMIDRISHRYVIDMFDFELINFPVFNVADIYVTCSVIVIFILILFKYNDKELEAVFKKK